MSTTLTTDAATARPKVHFETWGCQMNVADSEKMLGLLQGQHYQLTDTPEQADLIVLNTCHIREKSNHKVRSRLGVLKDLKKTNPRLKIAVTGCVAQAEGEKLLQRDSGIDLLLGPGKIDELPRLLAESAQRPHRPAIALGFAKGRGDHSQETPAEAAKIEAATFEECLHPAPSLFGRNEISRFVTIQQGCNNFCTFCVVPFTRGKEISVKPAIVAAKVRSLLSNGSKEITLLGQNVNSYGTDLLENQTLMPTADGPFVDLLRDLCAIPELVRLRFTTSNPHDLTFPLAQLFGQEPKLGKHFHLPIQSGSDAILEKMRRKVTAAEYVRRVQWLRDAVPDMALSTDLIVGFPGETDEDFQATLDLVEKVRYQFLYAFNYSPRKHTAAIRFKEQVPDAVKTKRLGALNALQDRITVEINEATIGNVHKVLFLYPSRKKPGCFYGRNAQFQLVQIESSESIAGQERDVLITKANKTALVGTLL